MPVLKYIRGEDFTDRHWMELFTVLEMIPKPVDTIVLKDFLQSSEKLIENTKMLSVCSTTVQVER